MTYFLIVALGVLSLIWYTSRAEAAGVMMMGAGTPVAGGPAYENFATYTVVESDPAHITVSTITVNFTDIPRNGDEYVYKDFGAAYFSGDFQHDIDVTVSAGTNGTNGLVYLWALGTHYDDAKAILDSTTKDEIGLIYYGGGGSPVFALKEINNGSITTSALTPGFTYGTPYYIRIKRVEADGTFGTLYGDVYPTDADRTAGTNVLANIVRALSEKQDFRYVIVTQSWNDGSADEGTGNVTNLLLTP